MWLALKRAVLPGILPHRREKKGKTQKALALNTARAFSFTPTSYHFIDEGWLICYVVWTVKQEKALHGRNLLPGVPR